MRDRKKRGWAYVYREELDDGLGEEQAEGPDEGDAQDLGEGFVRLEFGAQRRVARLFALARGFPLEQDGRVRFLEVEEAEELDHGVAHAGRPEDPAPGRVLRDEAAGDGAGGWADERGEAVHADGLATLLWLEHV